MPYAALSDLLARAGEDEVHQVADRDGDGLPDDEVVEAALLHADSTVDGYLGTRYALPLSPVPELVRTWAVAIARHWLHRDGAPEHVRQDFTDALSGLKDAAAGRLVLPDAAGQVAPGAQGGAILAAHPAQAFTLDTLRGWLQ